MGDIIEILKPIYYLLKIFGQANYEVKYNFGRITIYSCKKSKLYSILLIIFLTVTILNIKKMAVGSMTVKQEILYILFLFLKLLLPCTILINNIVLNDEIIIVLKSLLIFDKKMVANGINIVYKNNKKCIENLLILQITLAVLFDIFEMFEAESLTDAFLYFCFTLRNNIQLSILLQIEVFMILLKTRFDTLISNVIEQFRNNSKNLSSFLLQTARSHQEINSIMKILNDFFSIPIIIILILNVMISILIVYDVTQLSFIQEFRALYKLIFNIGFFILMVFYCSETNNSVSIFIWR